MYGGEKSPYSAYAQQASSYLDGYGNKHEAPGAHGSAKPHSGKFQDLNWVTILVELFLLHHFESVYIVALVLKIRCLYCNIRKEAAMTGNLSGVMAELCMISVF